MHIISKIVHFTPLSEKKFVQPQTQTWFKEADEKNAKMQDTCSKETKTTAASLYSPWPGSISVVVPQRYMLFCLHVYSLELYGFLTDVGQGRTALAVGADGFCLAISLLSVISLFFLPLSVRRPDID